MSSARAAVSASSCAPATSSSGSVAGEVTPFFPSLPAATTTVTPRDHSRSRPRVSGSIQGGRGLSVLRASIATSNEGLEARSSATACRPARTRARSVLPSCAATWTSSTSAPGATPPNSSSSPATKPAMKVPWPNPSPTGPSETLTCLATSTGALSSTPVSITATVTPDPVGPAGAPIVSRNVLALSLVVAVGAALNLIVTLGTTNDPSGAVTCSGRSASSACAISKVCTTVPPTAVTADATSVTSPVVLSSTRWVGIAAVGVAMAPRGIAVAHARHSATSPRGTAWRTRASYMGPPPFELTQRIAITHPPSTPPNG